MMEFAAGLITGILSGCGVGGGTLLVLWMTTLGGIDQATAGGINLLYFVGCAPASLPGHIRGGHIVWQAVLWCALAGALTAVGASLLATHIDLALLRRLFGGLLIAVGLQQWFTAKKTGA